MKYNFDEIVPRKHTDCLKYDNVMEIFGTEEILPMWIADMDFKTPPFIINAADVGNRLSAVGCLAVMAGKSTTRK